MGAALDIYRLYRWRGNHHERFVLAKATRPEFPNWSQTAEDAAVRAVDARFSAMLTGEGTGLPGGSLEFIAAWEGGFPDGDVFYGDASSIEVEVWLTCDNVHKGYFVFGVQPDEARFWGSLREMHELGEVCDLAEYSRPAQRVKVLFVQCKRPVNAFCSAGKNRVVDLEGVKRQE